MDEQQQIIELLREQNQLLKKYLWRVRFSLLFLMLMTTAICLGLAIVVYQGTPKVAAPVLPPPNIARPAESFLDPVSPYFDAPKENATSPAKEYLNSPSFEITQKPYTR
jgi:hypothetical protein